MFVAACYAYFLYEICPYIHLSETFILIQIHIFWIISLSFYSLIVVHLQIRVPRPKQPHLHQNSTKFSPFLQVVEVKINYGKQQGLTCKNANEKEDHGRPPRMALPCLATPTTLTLPSLAIRRTPRSRGEIHPSFHPPAHRHHHTQPLHHLVHAKKPRRRREEEAR